MTNRRRARSRELRVALTLREGASPDPVGRAVRDLLGDGWSVEPFTSDPSELLARGPAPAPAGTPAYARVASDAALRLERLRAVTEAEADVPVPAPAPGVRAGAREERAVREGGAGACPPGLDPGWARSTVRWAKALTLMQPAVRGGTGVRIGHPDTGYTLHPQLGVAALDRARDRDVVSGDADARDPLTGHGTALRTPGHGTSTGSVIAGRGQVGIANAANLVPIRAIESVVQLFDSDVAKAVAWARSVGCHVVSMSLGGVGLRGLRREIDRAVGDGMIVMAAAGNYVRFVTAPASYDSCLAVAATGPGDVPWDGSSRGSAVDVAAPGHCVYVAGFDWDTRPPGEAFGTSSGTSYAVAHLAGAAALWVAHHGHAALVARYGAGGVQAAFLATLRRPGVCVVPPGWDTSWGVGRLDVANLLAAPLPAGRTSVARARVRVEGHPCGAAPDDAAARLAATLDLDPDAVRRRLARLLGRTGGALDRALRRHERELVLLAMTDPVFAARLASDAGRQDTARAPRTEYVSSDLAALLR